jgi:hypothetical protein
VAVVLAVGPSAVGAALRADPDGVAAVPTCRPEVAAPT